MSNSKLVNYTKKSPNHSGKRTHCIDRITPHCVVGQCSVETLGNIFMNTACDASCNYGIGTDGRVLLCVDECNRSWCSSSNANDQRAVTIECASDTFNPYAMNSKVYNKLVDLCVDICKRNGKTKLLWFADKNKSLNYSPKSNEMVLTVHRWFANKSCPGDWLYSRLGNLAKTVTAKLATHNKITTNSKLKSRAYAYGDCKNICTMPKNSSIKHIYDDGYGWSKIKYKNIEGFVQNTRINNNSSLSKYPKMTANATANIYTHPDKKVKFGVLPKGTRITVRYIVERGKNAGMAEIAYPKASSIVFVDSKYLK